MRIAIYSRKSKFNEKSESTDNQIQICKEYALSHFSDCVFNIFEDDGFSGKDINRPQFQTMFNLIKNNQFDVLMVYRLDRVSRSVSDVSNIVETLNAHNTNFVSITEQFDTTSPMGKAMVNVASTFAQLERETIAERIKDNFLELGKKGRWTGGQTPTGYKSVAMSNGDKQAMYLEQDGHIDTIKIIFKKYKELENLSAVSKFLAENNIKTKNNSFFAVNTVRDILVNPVYAAADIDIYNYYKEQNSTIAFDKKDFTGEFGVVPYNRYKKNIDEYYISIGKHEPIISGAEFVLIQNIILKNHNKNIKSGTGLNGTFQGLVYCECGSLMRPITGTRDSSGKMRHYYMCTKKEKSYSTLCNSKNIIGYDFDKLILEYLRNLASDNQRFTETFVKNSKQIISQNNELDKKISFIDKEIANKKKQSEKLLQQILGSETSDFIKNIIIPKGDELAKDIKNLESSKNKLLQEKATLADIGNESNLIMFNLRSLNFDINSLDYDVKVQRVKVKKIISAINVKDNNIELKFNTIVDNSFFI